MRISVQRSAPLALSLSVALLVIEAPVECVGAPFPQSPPCSSPADLEPFAPVVTALEQGGIRVIKVCRSHFEGTFVAPNATAVVFTDIGGFDVVAFESEEALSHFSSDYTTEIVNGKRYYTTTITGLATRPAPFSAQGTQRVRFLPYGKSLIIMFDSRTERRIRAALMPKGISR
jgi:hypothetical protein